MALAPRVGCAAEATLKAKTLPLCLVLLAACNAPEGTALRADYASSDFWATPLPGNHRLAGDGTVDLSAFPNPDGVTFVTQVLPLIDGRMHGFGTTSAIYFPLDGPIDPGTLPSLQESVQDDASVFLTPVDPDTPEYGTRVPVTTSFAADGGPFGAPNTLALLPLQGVPLRPSTRYAAVVTRGVLDPSGAPLVPAESLRDVERGRSVEGLSEAAEGDLLDALAAARDLGLQRRDVVGLTAFTTEDPHAAQRALVADARTHLPTPTALHRTNLFDTYCAYEATMQMPVYQEGVPPYQTDGGAIGFDADGVPLLDHYEAARIFVTVPRATMPADGWPTAVMIRTGGGGDRPLIDRGGRDADGVVAEPGTGPALWMTAAGFAGVSVDGPHGGIRNVTGGDEQFLMFNFANTPAMRGNFRQSAAEIALLPDVLHDLSIDVSDCPDASSEARFDTSTLALFGHSMGATIAPVVLGTEPRFRAAVLSGAGGSWIENVVYKQKPLPVRPIAENLLAYDGFDLTEYDPVLTLLQWAGESADPPVWGPGIIEEPGEDAPRDVLMVQGIVDHYILPPIANATSVSLGLDLGGEHLDEETDEVAQFRPAAEVLPFGGGGTTDLPATGNRDGGAVTAVVVQHREDGIEDGHEVLFQLPGPKHQARCFLQTWRTGGVPVVPPSGALDDPCP